MNYYQGTLTDTSKEFAALGEPTTYRWWKTAGGRRRLAGMNMFQRFNYDLRLYQTGEWATLPVGILPAWQLSVISAQGFWDTTTLLISISIETAGFREDLASYIGYSWKTQIAGRIVYDSCRSQNVFLEGGYYHDNPGFLSVWLRPLSVGYPPGVKIKLAVPIQTIPG